MNNKRFLDQVSEFHRCFLYKQPESIEPDLGDKKTNELRPKLIKEEILELKVAIDSNHRIDQLDALVDIEYVITGAVLAWGFRKLWEAKNHLVRLTRIRDMDGHLSAMLGLNEQMEVAARLGYAMQTFTMLVYIQERLTHAVCDLKFAPVFDEAFAAVHANNLGKIWSETAYQDWHFTSQTGGDMLTFEKSIGGYIARNQFGKIIKPSGHTKVDLGRFV